MLRLLSLLLMSGCCCITSAAEKGKPILVVTPQGAWSIDIIDGVPQTPVAANLTVIVQGFELNPVPVPVPTPDPTPPTPVIDPVVEAVAKLSSAPNLASKTEAIACSALVTSLTKAGLTGDSFKNGMVVAAPIMDNQLSAGGRITAWSKAVTAVSTDPDKIVAGLAKSWSLSDALAGAMDAHATFRAMTTSEYEAVDRIDIGKIMEIITSIISLLQQLGILK